jgi:hypothetical protein
MGEAMRTLFASLNKEFMDIHEFVDTHQTSVKWRDEFDPMFSMLLFMSLFLYLSWLPKPKYWRLTPTLTTETRFAVSTTT